MSEENRQQMSHPFMPGMRQPMPFQQPQSWPEQPMPSSQWPSAQWQQPWPSYPGFFPWP